MNKHSEIVRTLEDESYIFPPTSWICWSRLLVKLPPNEHIILLPSGFHCRIFTLFTFRRSGLCFFICSRWLCVWDPYSIRNVLLACSEWMLSSADINVHFHSHCLHLLSSSTLVYFPNHYTSVIPHLFFAFILV